MNADRVAEILGLGPLPLEGGRWAQSHIDDHSTAIYYLLKAGECSALHRLQYPEIYHWYGGSPLQLLILAPDGTHSEPVLGMDLESGQRPQLTVAAGTWQGSTPLGDWSLVGTTMAPGYRDEEFELGDRAELVAAYPAASVRIRELLP